MISGISETSGGRVDVAVTIPLEIQKRVTVGPQEAWVKQREVDESFRHAASYSLLLFDRQHHASRNEDYYRVVRRLETRQAVHELGQWRLDFDPNTQHVVIHSLAVRRNGVTVEHANPDRFRFLQREGQLESLVIDGWVTVVVLMEDVRIDDVVDVSYTVHTSPRFLRDRSWLLVSIPSQAALRAFHLSVYFARGRAMQWKSNDKDFAPAVNELGEETGWSWSRENLQPLEMEPNVPPWHIVGTWVQVTDCASWEEVATGITSAWQEDFDNPELLRAVEEINASAATPAERADRALSKVQDDIRYLSLNVDLGGQIPASPGVVLQRHYGDCKDKSFLLAHMLRLLGISAQPVLVNSLLRQTVGELLPTPDAFNHAIVKYEIDGQLRWVDATLPLQGGGATDRLVPDFRLGLPVGPGVTDLEPIPALPAKNDKYELREIFSLDSRPGHPSILTVEIKASGLNAENMRRDIANVGKDELARRREQFYRQLFPELQRSGTLQWEDDRIRNEFRLTETFDLLNILTPAEDRKRFVFQYRAHYMQAILAFPDTGKRRYPFALPYPCNAEHCIEVETMNLLGDAKLPKIMKKGGAFHFSRDTRKKGNRAIVNYHLGTLTDTVTLEQFESYKKLVKELWPETHFVYWMAAGLAAPQRRQSVPAKSLPSPGPRSSAFAVKPAEIIQKVPLSSGNWKSRTRGGSKKQKTDYTTWIVAIAVIAVIAWVGIVLFAMR